MRACARVTNTGSTRAGADESLPVQTTSPPLRTAGEEKLRLSSRLRVHKAVDHLDQRRPALDGRAALERNPPLVEAVQHTNPGRRVLHALRAEHRLPGL